MKKQNAQGKTILSAKLPKAYGEKWLREYEERDPICHLKFPISDAMPNDRRFLPPILHLPCHPTLPLLNKMTKKAVTEPKFARKLSAIPFLIVIPDLEFHVHIPR